MGTEALDALLKAVANTKASAGGNFIRPGRYTLVLEKILLEPKYDGIKDSIHFIAELRVLESTSYEDSATKANPVGSTVTFLQQLEKNPQMAGKNTKAFMLALTGDEEADLDPEEFVTSIKRAAGKDQPLRGAVIKAETYSKTAKKSGKELTLPKWTPLDNTLESIAARRKELDAVPS